MKKILLVVCLFISTALIAQNTTYEIIINRVYVSDPELKEAQPLEFLKNKEFHLFFADDLNKKFKKSKGQKFYVDFLAAREKRAGDYVIEIRWTNMIFFNPQIVKEEVKPVNAFVYNDYTTKKPATKVIAPQYNNKYVFGADAILEINIYKRNESTLETVKEITKEIKFRQESEGNLKSSMSNEKRVNMDGTPNKKLLFKDMSLAEYEFISQAVIQYFKQED